MKHIWMVRIALLGCLWMGCSNPFSTDSYSPLTGVWGSESPFLEPQRIAFLSNGRYYENDTRVGVYVVTSTRYNPSPFVDLEGYLNTVRIDYLDGERTQVVIRTSTVNVLTLDIAENSGARGPVPRVVFNKLHTGDGL